MDLDAEGLHPIANADRADRKADIVFVPGLAGGSHSTWRHGRLGEAGHFFWPAELGTEMPLCGVWTVGYPAGITELGKPGMIIEKRAGNLAQKLVNAGLGARPLVFVTHSMGGLIVKSLLVDSETLPDAERKAVAGQVRGIVFCGTPHRGSTFADAVGVLAKAAGGSQDHVNEMRANAEPLDFLHDRFVEWHRRHPVAVESFAENIGLFRRAWWGRAIPLGLVVPRASANPGIAGHSVKDVDDDHRSLVKPRDRKHDVYAGVLAFIGRALESASPPPAGEEMKRLLAEVEADAAATGLIVRAHVLRVLLRQPSPRALMASYGVDDRALRARLVEQIARVPPAPVRTALGATESVATIIAKAREAAGSQADAGLVLWAALAEQCRQVLDQGEATLSASNREWRALLESTAGLVTAVRGQTPYR